MVSLKDVICHLPTANPFYPVYLAGYESSILRRLVERKQPPKNAAECWLVKHIGHLDMVQSKVIRAASNSYLLSGNSRDELFLAADPKPYHVWCRGELPPPPYLVVVGPRKPSSYAINMVKAWVGKVAGYCTVVSGLAYGLDTVALQAAIGAGGKVVAIVPTGVDQIYPAMNKGLAQSIIEQHGCVMSELLFCDFVSKAHFLMRNRLMAAMADLVWIPEAAMKSGTITTALMALKMGKEIAVLPGEVDRFTAEGSNLLIRDGAHCLASFSDMTALLKIDVKMKEQGLQKYESVIKCIGQGFDTPDKMVQELAINPSLLLAQLTLAKDAGFITERKDGSYIVK